MELFHHGVKGQQWGVTHGPPYPVEPGAPVHIKKGTKFKRISPRDETNSTGHAYVTYNKEDNDRYTGFFGARAKALNKGGTIYQHTLEAKEDLVSPSQKERIDTFIKLYNNDPEIGKILGKYHKHGESRSDAKAFVPSKWYEYKYSNLKDDEVVKRGYKTFVKTIGGDEYLRSEYFGELKKKGYNFIRDDQDSGKQGNEPSIIFDRENNLKYVSNRELTYKEIASALARNGIMLNKERRHEEYESVR